MKKTSFLLLFLAFFCFCFFLFTKFAEICLSTAKPNHSMNEGSLSNLLMMMERGKPLASWYIYLYMCVCVCAPNLTIYIGFKFYI